MGLRSGEIQEKVIIAVLGATGAQGGAVVAGLLSRSRFLVRAVTRNPESDQAKMLEVHGAEVVQADMDDVESLKMAFTGVYGAYFVTNYYEHMSVEREMQQIKNLTDAAVWAGLKLVINSSLEDSRELLQKQGTTLKPLFQDMYVPHFDGKAACQGYVSKRLPTITLLTSFYYENFFRMGPVPDEDGNLVLSFPLGDAILPMVALEDIGKAAAKLFEMENLSGRTLYVLSCKMTMKEVAATFTKVLGRTVTYKPISTEEYAALNFPAAKEFANMFAFMRDCPEFNQSRDVFSMKMFLPDPIPLEQWIQANRSSLPGRPRIQHDRSES